MVIPPHYIAENQITVKDLHHGRELELSWVLNAIQEHISAQARSDSGVLKQHVYLIDWLIARAYNYFHELHSGDRNTANKILDMRWDMWDILLYESVTDETKRLLRVLESVLFYVPQYEIKVDANRLLANNDDDDEN